LKRLSAATTAAAGAFLQRPRPGQIYEVDLQTKAYAFALAEKLGIGSHKIAVNLLPMSLVNVPGAVEFLVDQIKKHGLQPEQVVIEVTENEMISGSTSLTAPSSSFAVRGLAWRLMILAPAMPAFAADPLPAG
jgi:EAL domain-containing protein (putative c-di-GMP-specific phosphodiesterase class I)